MLKTDLHIHTSEDPNDNLNYSAKDLIRLAVKQKFDVLALTHHWQCYFPKDIQSYAKKQGILLIPGMEAQLKPNVHMLILGKVLKKNPSTFEALEDLKRQNHILTIAPHPFYPIKTAIKKRFFTHVDIIDALEHVNLYTSWFNPNKKTIEIGKKYDKTLLGNSDCHNITTFGHTYSMIDADKNQDSIFEAIRKGKVKIVTTPYSTYEFAKIVTSILLNFRHLKGANVKDYS